MLVYLWTLEREFSPVFETPILPMQHRMQTFSPAHRSKKHARGEEPGAGCPQKSTGRRVKETGDSRSFASAS